MSDFKKNLVDPSKVKVGDILAVVQYAKVAQALHGGTSLNVIRLDGDKDKFSITGSPLVQQTLSADYFAQTESVTMTEAARLLIDARNVPFTVCYRKQATKADPKGEIRTLRGRYIRHEELLGRSMVEDLDVESGNRVRQVDHRTIEWLVVLGTKYVVK